MTVRAQILELLGELRARDGLTLAARLARHRRRAEPLRRRCVVMKDGRIVEEGPTEKVLLQPQVAYTRRLLAVDPASIDPADGVRLRATRCRRSRV